MVATWTVKSPVFWVPRGVGVIGMLTAPARALVVMEMTESRVTSMSTPSDSAEELFGLRPRVPMRNEKRSVARKMDEARMRDLSVFWGLGFLGSTSVCVCVCVCVWIMLILLYTCCGRKARAEWWVCFVLGGDGGG